MTSEFMGTATQIRAYRVRAGKSPEEAAARLGINDAWYYDLEHDDAELESTLTLFQAMDLASFLNVRLRDLLGGAAWPGEAVPLAAVPSLIAAHVACRGISNDQFEEEVGWEIRELMDSPLKAAAESPIVLLQAVADRLGIDWRSMVPDEESDVG